MVGAPLNSLKKKSRTRYKVHFTIHTEIARAKLLPNGFDDIR